MSAWGRTGRVKLGPERRRSWPVLVDGDAVGTVWEYIGRPGGPAFVEAGDILSPDLPSLDAAVMWVLRRAAPDVWRAERGPVWRVASGCIRFGSCQCRYHWHIYRPDGSKYTDNGSTEGASGWHWAMCEVATERAHEATS